MLVAVFRFALGFLTITLPFTLCQPGITQTGDGQALFEHGGAAMRKGDAAGAVDDFQQFVRLQPGSAEGYFNLGLALESDGQLHKSLTALRKAALSNAVTASSYMLRA